MNNPFLKITELQRSFTDLRYKFFDNKLPFNLNIFGIRNDNRRAGEFDDLLIVAYRDNSLIWNIKAWAATTDPGKYWLHNPMNTKGTAILAPGQYRAAYAIDKHNGQYNALCQRLGPVRVFRDNNSDDKLDLMPDTEHEGSFGINIHRSNPHKASNMVNRWSAGCQVFRDPDDFDEFMDLCYKAKSKFGNAFTYTLFNQSQILT